MSCCQWPTTGVHSPTYSLCELEMVSASATAKDIEPFHLHTTPAFISAQLKPGEVIYCNPPRDIDIVIGANGVKQSVA